MSMALVTSATSAMRPWMRDREACARAPCGRSRRRRSARSRRSGQREQDLPRRRAAPERVDRGRGTRAPPPCPRACARRAARAGPRGRRAPAARGRSRASATSEHDAASPIPIACAREHDHERERDRQRGAVAAAAARSARRRRWRRRSPRAAPTGCPGCDARCRSRSPRPRRAGRPAGPSGFTLAPGPPAPSRDRQSARARPNRCRLRAERPPSRARRPRARRRSARRGVRWRAIRASTHSALNCVPAPSRSSANAVSWLSALRYERVDVIASNASATWMIAGSISPLAVDRRRGGLGGGVAGDRGEEVDAAQQLDRHALVTLHPLELGLGEAARLVEELVRHDRACRCRASARRSGGAPCGAGRTPSSVPTYSENIATRCACPAV